MNKICTTCDTRLRLGMCNGKEGDFRFCFRRCGSIEGTKESIYQFNDIEELYESPTIKNLTIKNLKMTNYYLEHVGLVKGEYPDGTMAPVGYVIK